MATLKTCFKCGLDKPVEEFYRHPQMSDGRLGKCIECTKLDVGTHRKNNLEKIRAYDRKRGSLPHRKQASSANTSRRRRDVVGYAAAHNRVSRAISSGVLIRTPCCMCDSIVVHAHHDDYQKPLDVMWVCAKHHKARHAYLDYLKELDFSSE